MAKTLRGLDVVLIWHIHQPFFIPEVEVVERIENSYRPLLDLHRSQRIPLTLNVTGALLERVAELAPSFLAEIRATVASDAIEATGSAFHHPTLPWLPYSNAQRQVSRDVEVKRSLLGIEPRGFWPTDLAWAHWLTPILLDAGLVWTVMDSSARVMAANIPAWRSDEVLNMRVLRQDFAPLAFEGESGHIARIEAGGKSLGVVFRHHDLSSKLTSVENGPLTDRRRLGRFMDEVREFMESGGRLLALGHDGEKINARTIGAYATLLEQLSESGANLLTGSSGYDRHAGTAQPSYLPASTFEVDYELWQKDADDFIYLRRLDDVRNRLARLEELAAALLLRTADDKIAEAQDLVMKAEDAGFPFYPYLARTRVPFYEILDHAQASLDEIEKLLRRPGENGQNQDR